MMQIKMQTQKAKLRQFWQCKPKTSQNWSSYIQGIQGLLVSDL